MFKPDFTSDCPYEVLGVARDASHGNIKAAYKALAKEYHPDQHKGDAEREGILKVVNAAFDFLKTPEKRAAYDAGNAMQPGLWDMPEDFWDFSAEPEDQEPFETYPTRGEETADAFGRTRSDIYQSESKMMIKGLFALGAIFFVAALTVDKFPAAVKYFTTAKIAPAALKGNKFCGVQVDHIGDFIRGGHKIVINMEPSAHCR